MNNKIELKPCPFCGGKAKFVKNTYGDNTGNASVRCTVCGARTPNYEKSLDWCAINEAADTWNRRTIYDE